MHQQLSCVILHALIHLLLVMTLERSYSNPRLGAKKAKGECGAHQVKGHRQGHVSQAGGTGCFVPFDLLCTYGSFS